MGEGQTMRGLVVYWKDTGFILDEMRPPVWFWQRSGLSDLNF